MRLNLLFLSCLWSPFIVEGYKILVYNPLIGQSHVNFMGKLADALVVAGHQVAVYQPVLHENVTFRGFRSPKIQHYILPKNMSLYEGLSFDDDQKALWDNDLASKMKETTKHIIRFCKEVMNDEKNLALLKAQNFDLGITEQFQVCGYGVLKRLNITKYVSTISNSLFPFNSAKLGIKPHWSYANGFTVTYTDKMNFFQRLHGFLSYFVEVLFVDSIVKSSEVAVREFYPDFDSDVSFANAAFVFVNADEHLDYVQPITPKIVYIGNLGTGDPKPLSAEYEEIVASAKKGFVIFSFGSVVQARNMPTYLKKVFLEAFSEFPDVKFLWKYETLEDGIAKITPPNVVTKTWLPQRDLLHHPKLLAFITHGGQNSFNEAMAAGVPLLCVPVFGDQPKNAQHVVSKGLGLQLHHDGLTKDMVVEALRELINNGSYRANAKHLSRIMATKSKWQTPEDRFVENVELAAEFGNTGTLSAFGAEQNVVVFHSLDVIAFLIVVVVVVIITIALILLRIVRIIKQQLTKLKSE